MAVLIAMALLRLVVRGVIKALGMTLSDRLLGLIFGVARGLAIVLILVAVGGMTALPKERWWSEAYFAAPLETAVWRASTGCRPTSLNESGLDREETMCGILGLSPPRRFLTSCFMMD